MDNKKKKKKIKKTFLNYLSIFLVIVTITLGGLIYFINILPLEYFIILVFLLVITDLIIIKLLLSKKIAFNMWGAISAIIAIILMILGITYELNTIDFFKQFGFNSYKTENYNVIVLSDSNYNEIKDLENEYLGHLDALEHKGLNDALKKIKKRIKFNEKEFEDIDALIKNLNNEKVSAIILEDAQLEIIKEENIDVYNKLKTIYTCEVEVAIAKIGDSVDVTKDAFNILISGIDTYGSITKVARSDVNILVTVNPKTNKILLTSIPRDYYVLLPSFNEYDKLTHAGIYGIEESIGAIENLLDTKINYYVKVNFTSLIDLVDTLGGITIESNYAFTSQDGYYYKVGTNELNGEKALSFARERKSFANGDRVRGENQEIVLTSLINKALSPKIITNYSSLLSALKNKFLTNVTNEEITSFIKMQLKDMETWQIEAIALDGTDSFDYTYSYKGSKLYVMKPNQESIINIKEKINSVLLGVSS